MFKLTNPFLELNVAPVDAPRPNSALFNMFIFAFNPKP